MGFRARVSRYGVLGLRDKGLASRVQGVGCRIQSCMPAYSINGDVHSLMGN